jgi:hypothetical protein
MLNPVIHEKVFTAGIKTKEVITEVFISRSESFTTVQELQMSLCSNCYNTFS